MSKISSEKENIDPYIPSSQIPNPRHKESPKLSEIKLAWKLYWLSVIVFTILLGIYLVRSLNLDMTRFRNLALSCLVLSLSFFFISMKLIPGGFNQAKQAICHMGRKVTRKGDKNTKAMIFFILYAMIEIILLYVLIHFIYLINKLASNSNWVVYFGFIMCLSAILTSIIPIDLYFKGHMLSALIFVICNNIVYHTLYTFILRRSANTTINIFWGIYTFFFILYIIGFIKRYAYAALFQKIYIVSINIMAYLYIIWAAEYIL